MREGFKRLIAKLSPRVQRELKRHYFAHQIRNGAFDAGEPEIALLSGLVSEGDWVIDVGANIGHYSFCLSTLVGGTGRVISFEPMPETHALLAANMLLTASRNVSTLNAAASDHTSVVGMQLPLSATGLANYYRAQLVEGEEEATVRVLSLSIDSLDLPKRVRFVKIDAEGHEMSVLRGMRALVARDRPLLLVETDNDLPKEFLAEWGYVARRMPGSANVLFSSGEPPRA